MKACPECKGRATKLFNISTGVTTCQQCGYRWKSAPEGPSPVPAEPLEEQVTRFEVIDWTGRQGGGRVYSHQPCRIELSYQDSGRTLKVFVHPAATPPAREER